MIKTLIGRVVATYNSRTARVKVETAIKHPKYLKTYYKTAHYLCHDPMEVSRVGDVVAIQEINPVTPKKNFEVARIVKAVDVLRDKKTGVEYSS